MMPSGDRPPATTDQGVARTRHMPYKQGFEHIAVATASMTRSMT
jgi:hypothetical protein